MGETPVLCSQGRKAGLEATNPLAAEPGASSQPSTPPMGGRRRGPCRPAGHPCARSFVEARRCSSPQPSPSRGLLRRLRAPHWRRLGPPDNRQHGSSRTRIRAHPPGRRSPLQPRLHPAKPREAATRVGIALDGPSRLPPTRSTTRRSPPVDRRFVASSRPRWSAKRRPAT